MKTLLVALLILCSTTSTFAASNCDVAVDGRDRIPQEFTAVLLAKGYRINYMTSVEVCSLNGVCRTEFVNPDMSPSDHEYYFEFNHISKQQFWPAYKTELVFARSNNNVVYTTSKPGHKEAKSFVREFSKSLMPCN